jgi:hypothetical protein
MNPVIWGPPMWISLHSITLNYPEKPTTCQENMIREFFWNVQFVLPCEMCRNHYAEMIRTHPPITKDRRSLVYWLIDRHNEVNKRLGKREYSYEEVLQKYQKLYNLSNKPNAILELSKDDNMGVSCSNKNSNSTTSSTSSNKSYNFQIKMEDIKIPAIILLFIIIIVLFVRSSKKKR